MQIISSILKFIKDLFTDGYKPIGFLAPGLSISFTVCKIWEVPLNWLLELSYPWAFLPILIWIFISYVRRWSAYNKLEAKLKKVSNQAKESTVNNFNHCTVHMHSDGTSETIVKHPTNNNTKPTFAIFQLKETYIITESNNISGITDSGIGNIGFTFIEPIKKSYFVRVSLNNSATYKIAYKDENGFNIIFDVPEPEEGQVIIEEC